jgi:hypothetical protein
VRLLLRCLGGITGTVLVMASIGPASAGTSERTVVAKPPSLATGSYPKGAFAVRPPVIGGWTGDGTGFVGGADGRPNAAPLGASAPARFGRIRWTKWSKRKAEGKGVVWTKGCVPDCAAGRWSSEPTRISAFRVRGNRYTRLAFTYDAGDGRRRHVFRLRIPNNDWI